jgi:hypothetical protein
MSRIVEENFKSRKLQAIGEDQSDSAVSLARTPERTFSVVLARIAAHVTAGAVSRVARDLKANRVHRIPTSTAQTTLQDAMPPRAILDMELGGNGSELHGQVGFLRS